jgi:hypothetical protein
MTTPVLVCLDETPPAPQGTCTTTAWIEQPSFPSMSVEDAAHISGLALVAWVSVAAIGLVRKAG